ncbi:hypothetical protein EVAR_4021_1 [Eumeta japonica]|uniref:Uncharacterized protein n=1 Tax=Eumeta variegata TaxID=151549 RepID=A0A4C1T6C4_EUMVA|nr:hypothetical protein EVAR_4021_1 [Eumeta japonica]
MSDLELSETSFFLNKTKNLVKAPTIDTSPSSGVAGSKYISNQSREHSATRIAGPPVIIAHDSTLRAAARRRGRRAAAAERLPLI